MVTAWKRHEEKLTRTGRAKPLGSGDSELAGLHVTRGAEEDHLGQEFYETQGTATRRQERARVERVATMEELDEEARSTRRRARGRPRGPGDTMTKLMDLNIPTPTYDLEQALAEVRMMEDMVRRGCLTYTTDAEGRRTY